MIYLQIFLAFFVSNILGYGGGPSTIPLIEHEVVNRYGWLSVSQFAEVLALGNALPGPIATKMAGFIGYQEGGALGSFIAVFATVAPSVILMLLLLGLLMKFRDSPKVKRMTILIRPAIAVLLGTLTFRMFQGSYLDIGFLQAAVMASVAYVLMVWRSVHPAYVILGAMIYGAIFLA
ncbi:MAG: chromate transporter [Bacillota bacterium]